MKKTVEASVIVGEIRAYNTIREIAYTAMMKRLIGIQESGDYKQIPGCNNWDDILRASGLGRSTAYKNTKTFKTVGEEGTKALMRVGFSPDQIAALVSGKLDNEDVEFEVIEPGVIRYDGRRISLEKNPREFEAAMSELRQRERTARLARVGLERTLEVREKGIELLEAELERKDRKIQAGEQQLRDVMSTELEQKIIIAMRKIEQVLKHKWNEEDLKLSKQSWSVVDKTITEPLRRLFAAKINDLELMEAGVPPEEEGE